MAGKHGHSKSSKSKGKGVDRSATQPIELQPIKRQPRTAEDRKFERGRPDPEFWQKDTATRTWNYVQSGSTTVYDDRPGPSTREGDIELQREMAKNTAQHSKQPKQHSKSQRDHQGHRSAPKRKSKKKSSSSGSLCCF